MKKWGSIHTIEKLCAAMARTFILVGDENKYTARLTNTYPVVLEVLPQARTYVPIAIKGLFADTVINYRHTNGGRYTRTQNNNLLLYVWFAQMPEPALLDIQLNRITRVVETSLFYNLANKAIRAGAGGITVLQKEGHIVEQTCYGRMP
ncbi:ribose-5-phosphate isomerase A [Panacibacter sp. DH6]|uniref:ribose-5-phosphate isomerase n=1 Tax=Panacibacter microcysteis TaxID=2793269 RepID=A0A931H0I7_9BACT|nr:ribose-5-phosphate isomerase A [Panacibacter microcysteis]